MVSVPEVALLILEFEASQELIKHTKVWDTMNRPAMLYKQVAELYCVTDIMGNQLCDFNTDIIFLD